VLTAVCAEEKMREIVALAFAAGAAASPFDKNKWHFPKKPHGWYVKEAHVLPIRLLGFCEDRRGRPSRKVHFEDACLTSMSATAMNKMQFWCLSTALSNRIC
jgi:hypothetical protein